jgi:hypothetical protein
VCTLVMGLYGIIDERRPAVVVIIVLFLTYGYVLERRGRRNTNMPR